MTDKQMKVLKEKFPWVQLDFPDFTEALELLLNSDDNLCICAPGGSGKSVLLKIAASMLHGNSVVLSTTGVSAANLAGEGVVTSTVHSFFRLPPVSIVENPVLYPDLAMVMQKIDTILIDEVSMLNASIMDTVLKSLRRYRAFEKSKMPRVILFGDVLQLPPVIDDRNETIVTLFKRKYNGKYMFFNAETYKDLNCKVIHLNHIYRQDDTGWKTILNRIRVGEHTKADLDCINSRVVDERTFVRTHELMMYLAATNKRIQALNDFYLDTDNSVAYQAHTEGIYDLKGTNHKMVVEIAPGMQVMCIHNAKDKSYQNGTLGKAIGVYPQYVLVQTRDGHKVEVGYENWDQYKYKYDSTKDIVEHDITGTFSQIGCTPAFAATIHKSQGLTLDALMLDPSGLQFMSAGLAYVALSRCTSLAGIGLFRPLTMKDIKTSREGLDFLEEHV